MYPLGCGLDKRMTILQRFRGEYKGNLFGHSPSKISGTSWQERLEAPPPFGVRRNPWHASTRPRVVIFCGVERSSCRSRNEGTKTEKVVHSPLEGGNVASA